MKYKLIILYLSLIILFALNLYGNKNKSLDSTNYDYQIYSLIIKEWFSDFGIDTNKRNQLNNPEIYVINNKSVGVCPLIEWFPDHFNLMKTFKRLKIDKKADYIIDFLSKNRDSIEFDFKKFILNKPIYPFNDSIDSILRIDINDNIYFTPFPWENFYIKFPGSRGIFSFSRIGYNARNDKAILYADRQCGGLCADGYWIILEKKKGIWKIKKKHLLWQS